ncbi:sodium-dependent nutrient amino acid transporter 1-like [Pectinophora gossypiella]|uniref:sodium-dependent nutrient amino acid transporter 1-like n=1 Tax=Pectinophora gossypiella TaxID=13191 RepID=UPI00214EEBE0|nr:sodium-dependent nutrient amino acid transporter 1-like [Pectinophora gossypiella]
MAVVTRPCGIFPCVRNKGFQDRTPQNVWTLKATCDFLKTQLCIVAISLTLFNSVRLPREAFRHGAVPYLVVYSFWLLVAGLPTTLLQLAMGQLSQQDPVGVWRAVPILRGVGHLRILTSYLCCVYNMMYVSLAAAYLIWIGKGSFPLRDCTKLHITPQGYENRMNASECFNATFLAPFTEYPQYLGIMSILIFILWFFVPILLFRLRKSLKVSLNILGPLVIIMVVVLCTFLADNRVLTSLFRSCKHWAPLAGPYIWQSALVQALLSSQVVGGYLISAGGTVYRQSDVRWTSTLVITTNVIAGWLWVLFWELTGGEGNKDTSFISILVLIYQSSISEKRTKEWPLLAFGAVFVSGVITLLILLFPIYDKLQRMTGDHWRLVATAGSAVGTALTVAILARGLEVASILDELVVPILAIFTTAVEVVGFVFIYGWCYLTVDIEFLTGGKLSCCWMTTWSITPVLLFGVTGWWLRALIRSTWGQMQTLWPLVAVFVAILVVMVIMAAVAVAKEEQYNLFTKIAAAFRPSRLWGPEEPLARYIWMSQRYANDTLSSGNDHVENTNYAQIVFNKENEKKYNDTSSKNNESYQSTYYVYTKNGHIDDSERVFRDVGPILASHNIPRSKKKVKEEDKFRSPNICIAKTELGGPIDCNCNRHFTLNVPNLRNTEVSTSL